MNCLSRSGLFTNIFENSLRTMFRFFLDKDLWTPPLPLEKMIQYRNRGGATVLRPPLFWDISLRIITQYSPRHPQSRHQPPLNFCVRP